MSESTEQQAVIHWFRLQYPDKIIFAIPNGAWLSGDARRRCQLVNKMKREGLLLGVSDLCIPEPTEAEDCAPGTIAYCGLYLEMKNVGATQCKVAREQKKFIEDMRARGYAAEWAAGFDHAQAIIKDYMEGVL